MNHIKQLRSRFGFTQAALANYLGINLAQLAMAEIGRRSLPTEANARLNNLEKICRDAEAKEIPPKIQEMQTAGDAKTREELEYHALVCKRKAKDTRKNLVALQKRKDQLLLSCRLNPLPTSSGSIETADLQLELHRREAQEALEQFPYTKMSFLALELDMLEWKVKKVLEILAAPKV